MKEFEVKVSQLEVALQRKDEEGSYIKDLLEKTSSQKQTLQDELVEQAKQLKVIKEKRDNGLKEIEKLKDKIAKIKEQHKLEMMNMSQISDLDTSVCTTDPSHRVGTETSRSYNPSQNNEETSEFFEEYGRFNSEYIQIYNRYTKA